MLNFLTAFIVGAGSAGAVVASRLSEIRNWTVLLIEAGGDETEISDIPGKISIFFYAFSCI